MSQPTGIILGNGGYPAAGKTGVGESECPDNNFCTPKHGQKGAQNEANAIFDRAVRCAIEQDRPEAARLYKQAADMGHADATHNLAVCHALGLGVEQDRPEAARLYKQAADMGHANAIHNLAACYALGLGVDRDDDEAVKLYIKAANMGNRDSLLTLADRYKKGRGVKQDNDEADRLLRIAEETNPATKEKDQTS